MGSTGFEQPKITDDYTYMFDGINHAEPSKALWRLMKAALVHLEAVVEQRNVERAAAGRREYYVFLPSRIETAISI